MRPTSPTPRRGCRGGSRRGSGTRRCASPGDEAFGLHLSERLPVDGFGALGFAVRSSATVGEAYARVLRFLRLMAHGPVLTLTREGPHARFRHTPPRGEPQPSRHAVEFLLTNLVTLARHAVDPAFMPERACFRHAAPADLGEHRRLLGPRLAFAAEHDELWLDAALLERPQRHAEPALAAVLDEQLASRLAALPREEVSFLDLTRNAIAAELAHGEPTLEAVAGRLHMSSRSLQRRLQQEGTSLSLVLDRLRSELAVRLLGESREAIGEVAFRLGFSDVTTFHRAFRRWTGQTPAAYRRGASAAARSAP
ncbi:MAG: AraC family transcriptional regulator [Myxococcota bacterium]